VRSRTRTVISVFAGFLIVSVAPLSHARAAEDQDPPRVCQDREGQLKRGEIDVLVLMDNSRSLEAKNQEPTDPNGLRFTALDEFIDNFAGLTSDGKNFGLIKFSTAAEVVVEMQPINSQITGQIKSQIRERLGEASGPTDYVKAFDKSLEVMAQRPVENCKIIIWFTDGEFNTYEGDKDDSSAVAENLKRDLQDLESRFCAEGGFAEQIQSNDINTFVVFLGSGVKVPGRGDQRRIDASIDVMQVITGDEVPSIQQGTRRNVTTVACADLMDAGVRHLGEVVSAAEAGDLLGYLTDLANIADGGRQAIQGECPLDSQTIESFPMPSGYFIDWISVTSWDGGDLLSTSKNMKVQIGSEEFEINEFFDASSASDNSNVVRFVSRPGVQDGLQPGWKLRATDVGRVCIRVKPQDLKFRLSGDQVLPVSPALPSSLHVNEVSLFVNKELVSVSEAASRADEGVTGTLRVENGEVFSADGTLPISVEVSELPILLSERCRLELIGSREASDVQLSSTTCEVFPAPAMTFTLDAKLLLAGLESCGLGSWYTTVNGERSDKIVPGSEPVVVGISSDQVPPNRDDECSLEQPQLIALAAQSSSASSSGMPKIDVLVSFEIVKKASLLVALLLTSISMVIISLLSLVLLRLVNAWTSKTVRAQDYFGYETELELGVSQSGRGELRIVGQGIKSFVADIDQLQTVSGNKNQTSLHFGSVRLIRQLPRFTRPFDESRLVLDSKLDAVFRKANRSGDGLLMAFPYALILAALDTVAPKDGRSVRARMSVLVPKRGTGSGVDGVQQLVRTHGDDLATELGKKLLSDERFTDQSGRAEKSKTAGPDIGNPSPQRPVPGGNPPGPKNQETLANPTPLAGPQSNGNRLTQPPEPPKRNI
jgi:hypothetical protein